jgi:hypothetical protein
MFFFFLIFVFVYYVFEIRNILVGPLKYVYCLNNNFAIHGKNSVFHDIYSKRNFDIDLILTSCLRDPNRGKSNQVSIQVYKKKKEIETVC